MAIMHISRDIIKQLYMAMKLIINPLDETWGRAPERDRSYYSAYTANALEDNNEYTLYLQITMNMNITLTLVLSVSLPLKLVCTKVYYLAWVGLLGFISCWW